MKYTKIIVLGGILTVFAVLFQISPVIFSEFFAILTIFSALPVYMISRIKPIAGLSSYAAAAILILIFSLHEGFFFIFTNGLVGLCLGVCSHYSFSRTLSILTNSLILFAALNILTVFFGINVFGVSLPFSFWLQSSLILAFTVVYSFIYMRFAEFMYLRLSRLISN